MSQKLSIYCQNRNGYLDHGFKSISMVLELALLREAVIGTEPWPEILKW